MSDEPVGSRLADLLRTLKPKDRQPVSAAVLNNWIFQAESKLGSRATNEPAASTTPCCVRSPPGPTP